MTNEELVDKLLYPCWIGIDPAYKSKYRSTIWVQFENAIKAAAYTHSLARFIESLTRKLGIELLAAHVAGVAEVCSSPEGIKVLEKLRSETTLLVVMTRVKNDERKTKTKGKETTDDNEGVGRDDNGSLFN